jgi:TonB-linked SusC/RagA family outer membrane protein
MLFFCSAQVFSQKIVSGRVTAGDGSALIKATVQIKGRANVTVTTDETGKFSINVTPADVLVVSFSGYKTREVQVGNGNEILVSLEQAVSQLDDVVVIGYGTIKKRDLTGSVSRISTKDFKDQPVNRLDQALQGRAAGVEVTNSTGAPGGDVKIRIRGANSILGDNNPLYVIDGFIGADLNNINPDDIASIEVLKDASSTAIYGSRGANGVVLITTRHGNTRKPEITLGYTNYTSVASKKYKLLNAADFAQTVNERNQALGLAPTFTQAQVDGFRVSGGTNWQDEIFRTAPGQEYKLGVLGGNGKSSYNISANYLNQDGVVVNSGYKRYSMRSNLSSQVNDNLSIRLNIAALRREHLNNAIQGKSSPINQALAWAPTTSVRDSSGKYIINDPVGSIFQNPVALAYDQTNQLNITDGTLVGGANYRILKDLILDVSFGVDYQNVQGAYYNGPSITSNLSTASRTSAELKNLQNTNNLTYAHIFNGGHSLSITAVFEQQKYTSTGFNAGASNLTFPNLGFDNLSLSASQSAGSNYSKSNLLSYLGRVNYSFRGKYLLTASIRRDGSSKFQDPHKYGTFPSAAFGWTMSEEPFIKRLNIFGTLKLRGSYGVTGSQAINPYATLATYLNDQYSAGNSFNNSSISSGIVIGNASNPNLKWETTTAEDLGLDMSLLNGRLNFTADGYIKHTKDLLVSLPLPSYTGGGSIISNVGKVKNSGVEFSIEGMPIALAHFSWTSTFNVTFQKNVVRDIGSLKNIFSSSNVGSGLSPQPEFIIMPGRSLGSYWGLCYMGTWKPKEAAEAALYGSKPGDSRYQDLDGDHAITTSDYQIIGNGLPKQLLGWNNTFNYQGFELNIFFQGILGVDKLNYSYGASVTANSDARQATNADIKDRYITGVNETSNIPAFSSTDKDYFESSRFIEKGNFIRLKNLNLSYDLTIKAKGIKIKIFAGATNLFTITKYKGYDPESSNAGSGSDITQSIDYGSYPNTRTYILGTTIKL